MKRITLLLLTIGIVFSTKAQNDSLTKDGTTWQYVYTSLLDFSCNYIVTDGDTLVNGKTYKKLIDILLPCVALTEETLR